MITNKNNLIKKKKSPLLAFRFAEQRQKIRFCVQNRVASPRSGRAKSRMAVGEGLEPPSPYGRWFSKPVHCHSAIPPYQRRR